MGDNFWEHAPVLITSLGAFITSIVSAYIALKTNRNVAKIETATNSMKDALVNETDKRATLEGHAQGVKDEKIRAQDEAATQTVQGIPTE